MKKSLAKTIASLLATMLLLSSCSGAANQSTADSVSGESVAPQSSSSGSNNNSNTLVLYASTPEEFLTPLIEGFEAATGIKVERVEAGTGELMKRIEAEGDNPLGDVMLGGMVSSGYLPKIDLFEEYQCISEGTMPEQFRNTTGKVTSFNMVPSVLMVNYDELEKLGIQITGYKDLLQPELKGLIAMPDPSKTSSGWEQLVNILYDMGDGNPENGWVFVDELLKNMEGKLLQGSSAAHKGVADGEYVVGLVAESMVNSYVDAGLNVGMVYMKEGVVVQVDGIAIIKGAKNRENAQKFLDYITSKEFQETMPALYRRPVRTDVDTGENLIPIADIPMREVDDEYLASQKEAILSKFQDLMTDHAS